MVGAIVDSTGADKRGLGERRREGDEVCVASEHGVGRLMGGLSFIRLTHLFLEGIMLEWISFFGVFYIIYGRIVWLLWRTLDLGGGGGVKEEY